MEIRTKRIYQDAAAGDGYRVLIDRVWPRGVSKQAAAIDHWAKDLAPSTELRTWYRHDPERWDGFRRRYLAELAPHADAAVALLAAAGDGPLTICFASRETELNNASVFREFLLALRDR